MSDPDTAWERHELACEQEESFYIDPDTDYHVFTAFGLTARGKCCGSGCRHCPWAHEAIPIERRAQLVSQPAWLNEPVADDGAVDVLFFSGGKDSFLAYRALVRENLRPVVLLTTFDQASRNIAHQELHIDLVVKQARHLDVGLIGVPLHPGREYVDQIFDALNLLPGVARLVFGDLHLEHIRRWREEAFEGLTERLNATLHFPLWKVSYDDLIDELEASGIVCEVSAVTPDALGAVRPGERFTRTLMHSLPGTVDAFGECGEFHTLARVWDTSHEP